MTAPLITQEDIEDILYDVLVHLDPKTTLHLPLAAAVYDMLLRELTPDVLHPAGYDHDGYDLHKRIFGEDG